LSQQIKQLDTELHTQLLWRTRRHVELTEAGKAFLEAARKTLAQADQAARIAKLVAQGETGQLQLGFIDSALYGFLPPLLRSFRNQKPDIQVVLNEMTSGQQVEALERSEIQVGILRPTRGGPQIAFHEIGRERLIVALPRGHPLAGFAEVPIEALEHENWILFRRLLSPGLHDLLVGICRRAGFTPRVAQEAQDGHTIIGLVGAGLGVSVTAESLQQWGGPAVVFRPLRAPAPSLPMSVAWRRDDRAPVVRQFVEMAKARADWAELAPPDSAAPG